MKNILTTLFLCILTSGCISNEISEFYRGTGKNCFRVSIRTPIWDSGINQFRIDYRIENVDSKDRELGAEIILVSDDTNIRYSNPNTGEEYTKYIHHQIIPVPALSAVYGSFFISSIRPEYKYNIECKYYVEDKSCFDIIESPKVSY